MSASTPEAGADLELRGIRKTFPGFTALHDLDLVIPAGSFFALLGPSGCGKTTTLRIVAGLERPTAGSISIGGKDVTSVPPHKRPVNTVFQSYALFPHMTVQENVEFGLRRRKVTDAASRALDALKLVELDHVAGRKPSQMSGGQQQRVALARAIVNRPALLLLDEPLGALDLKLRRQMQSELKTIQDEVGITFLHVTHDQEEAMTMADTVAVMNHGRIEQMGAPQELYELPRTGFVASFLGQSNLIAGAVESAAGGTLVARTAAGGTLRMPIERAVSTSGTITVGVRPEKLMLASEAPTTDDNVLGPGRITDLSFTGVSTQYTVEMPGIGSIGVFEQNMVFGSVFAVGSEVWVRWRPEHTFGLDADAQAGAAEAIADSEDA
ncbi:ABC transporter ATP-binding protein [Microbacterium schleiferi]|uniref:Spermidine/putrescine import ATP-binding protein PotA n=1 Tax=Microbacterium schleiferi TaxID=69362 RepID=A0A7S8MYC9_9MICO|nr:ABC transporter ATP-binding protein [Microbacterium schleiferi]QPE05534.1 ABC transporter ATP-binding protein [Microbacterium schleiferi]